MKNWLRRVLLERSARRALGYSSLFDQGSAASIDATDPANVRIAPISHWDSKWLWWAVKHTRLGDTTPTYLIAKSNRHAAPVANENLGVWAQAMDTETWNKFANQSVGVADISLSHDSAFPSGKIYIAHIPMYPFSRVQRKVAAWRADAYVSDAASETDGVIGYATARDAGDGSGRTALALPFYGLKVSSGAGTKNKAILTGLNHANETQGAWQLEGAVEWLLGRTALSEFLLDYFDFYVYPCLNPQGVWSGYFRSSPETPASDNNRLWDGSGVNEAVDAFKVAMLADTGGAIEVGLDFHGTVGTIAPYLSAPDHTAALYATYIAKMQVYNAAFTYDDVTIPEALRTLWAGSYSAALAATVEGAQSTAMTLPADWKTQGANALKSLALMLADGRWTNNPGVGSRDFNGTSDRLDWSSPWNPTGSPMTVSLWANLDSVAINQYLMHIGLADNSAGIQLAIAGASGAVSFARKGSTNLSRISAGGVLTTGAWAHILITHNGTFTDYAGLHIYKNGVEVSYNTNQNGASESTASGSWSLGGRILDDLRNTNGKLAQAAVWNRVLTPTEIANLAAGYAPDLVDGGSSLKFYFKGSTSSLAAVVGGTATADGTTSVTGVGNGPGIIY